MLKKITPQKLSEVNCSHISGGWDNPILPCPQPDPLSPKPTPPSSNPYQPIIPGLDPFFTPKITL